MPLEIQIGQVLDANYLQTNEHARLEIALNFVKNKSALRELDIDCSLLLGCPEKARKTIQSEEKNGTSNKRTHFFKKIKKKKI